MTSLHHIGMGCILAAIVFLLFDTTMMKSKFWDARKETAEAILQHENYPGWHEDLRTYQEGLHVRLQSLDKQLLDNSTRIKGLETRLTDARSQLDTLNTSISALLARLDDVIAHRDDDRRKAGRGL